MGVLQPVPIGNTATTPPPAVVQSNDDLADIFGLGSNTITPTKDNTPTTHPNTGTGLDIFSIPAAEEPKPQTTPPLIPPLTKTETEISNTTPIESTPSQPTEDAATVEHKQETDTNDTKIPQPESTSDEKPIDIPTEPVDTEIEQPPLSTANKNEKQKHDHPSHTRSASLVTTPIREDTETEEESPITPTHHRSPSDSAVVSSAPAKFQPININTNWSSLHVRTMQIQVSYTAINLHKFLLIDSRPSRTGSISNWLV